MTDTSRVQSSAPSRRLILARDITCMAGGAALLGSAPYANAAKMAPSFAAYQDLPKDSHQCSNCSLFQAPNSCTVVDGTISPSGWCKLWAKKT